MMSFSSGSEGPACISAHFSFAGCRFRSYCESYAFSRKQIFTEAERKSSRHPPARLDVLGSFGFLIIGIEGNGLHTVNPRRGMGVTPPNAFQTHTAP